MFLSLNFHFPLKAAATAIKVASPKRKNYARFISNIANIVLPPSGLLAPPQRPATLMQESVRMFPALVILDIKAHSYLWNDIQPVQPVDV